MLALATLHRLALLSIITINVIITAILLKDRLMASSFYPSPNYSYIGDDFPSKLDIQMDPVEMTFEETSSYPIEGELADYRWASLRPQTHLGYLRLGPDNRVFSLAMFHAIHCLNVFRQGLIDVDYGEHHIQHCLNYLRQLFMCSADSTLEPYDFMTRNFTQNPVGVTRQCNDWSAVHENLAANWNQWKADLARNNSYSVVEVSLN